MILKKKKQGTIFLLAAVILLAAALWYAPDYLAYSDAPVKSDAVVLFLGPDFGARQKEAGRLFLDGYADWLIIPAYGRVVSADHFLTSGVRNPGNPEHPAARGLYPRFYEDTHIEALEAKRFMDALGMKKALFVSSPSHIRRIRIIVSRVLPGSHYSIRFIPTRYEEPPSKEWLRKKWRLRQMSLEYVKIVWFGLYNLFSGR